MKMKARALVGRGEKSLHTRSEPRSELCPGREGEGERKSAKITAPDEQEKEERRSVEHVLSYIRNPAWVNIWVSYFRHPVLYAKEPPPRRVIEDVLVSVPTQCSDAEETTA